MFVKGRGPLGLRTVFLSKFRDKDATICRSVEEEQNATIFKNLSFTFGLQKLKETNCKNLKKSIFCLTLY